MNNDQEWPDTEIARLRILWDEGHSTPEIGRRMGRSKNSIVGKAHRLNFPPRPSPIIRDGERRDARPRIHRPHRKVSTLPALASAGKLSTVQIASLSRRPPKPVAEQPRLPLLPVGISRCQFPLWGNNERPPRDPKAKRFCDAPVSCRPGTESNPHWYPYCAACALKAYRVVAAGYLPNTHRGPSLGSREAHEHLAEATP